MATISWIKDNLNGRLGSVVGSSWKGINYVKVFTAPSNPNTAGQRQIRGAFGHIMHIGCAINKEILSHETPKAQKQTNVNRFLHNNKHMLAQAVKWIPEELVLFASTDAITCIFAPTLDAATQVIKLNGATPAANSAFCFVAYDTVSGKIAQKTFSETEAAAGELSIAGFEVTTDISIHVFWAEVKVFPPEVSGTAWNSGTSHLLLTA